MLETHQERRSPALLPSEDAPATVSSVAVQPFPLSSLPTRGTLTRLNELRNGLAARGLGWLPSRLTRCAGVFGILMYHRICDAPEGASAPTWNVSPGRFRAQMEGLLTRGFRPWPLRKVLEWRKAERSIPAKVFVVTFDDVYANVYLHAFPVLRAHGIPATAFLATGYLDSPEPFPFDDWPSKGSAGVPADAWKPITTEQCREMLASGLIELGTHTHSHLDFRGRGEELRDDLAVSREVLRNRFGVSEPSFALPFGYGCCKNDGPGLMDAVRQAGVCCALTTDEELVRWEDDPFNWGRFGVWETDSAGTLATKLDGRYSLARRAWKLLRRRANDSVASPAIV